MDVPYAGFCFFFLETTTSFFTFCSIFLFYVGFFLLMFLQVFIMDLSTVVVAMTLAS